MSEPEWISYNGSTTVLFASGQDAVTQIGNDLTSDSYNFLSTLGDIGITWEIVNGVPLLTGNAKPEKIAPASLQPKPEILNSQKSSNLIDTIKESNSTFAHKT